MNWKKTYDAMYVAPSRIVGQGLYAGTSIKAKAKIGEFEGEQVSIREARRRAKTKEVIAIVECGLYALDATESKRGFRFINHSCDPNTFTRVTDTRAEFYALRDIRKGEELTVDYEESHHDGKLPCRCGAKNCRGKI
jgi:SET domain-containing protein